MMRIQTRYVRIDVASPLRLISGIGRTCTVRWVLWVLIYSTLRLVLFFFFFSSRRRHTRSLRDWSSDVCSSDLWMEGKEEVRVQRPATPSVMSVPGACTRTSSLPPIHAARRLTSSDWRCHAVIGDRKSVV